MWKFLILHFTLTFIDLALFTPFGLVKMDPPMEAERTNGETLIWVQSLKGYGQATLKSAKSFMHFDGDCRQLKLWKERFLMEHKKIKQDIQTRLMRECGGYGRPLSKSAKRLCA